MSISYEVNPENPNRVTKVELPTDGQLVDVIYDDEGIAIPGTGYVPRIATYYGYTSEVRSTETDSATTYYHAKINLDDGTYVKDADDTDPIEVDGVPYPLDASGKVVIAKATPLMAFAQAQAVMSARALGVALPLAQEAEAQVVVAMAAGVSPAEKASAEWTPGEYVGVGTVRTYGGTGYSCVQPHVTQAGWTPDAVPALWTPVREDAADWTQPAGAHDAYKVGDIVTHDGRKWISTVDGNVWPPGVSGWDIVPE